jgi:hypothetical protein
LKARPCQDFTEVHEGYEKNLLCVCLSAILVRLERYSPAR